MVADSRRSGLNSGTRRNINCCSHIPRRAESRRHGWRPTVPAASSGPRRRPRALPFCVVRYRSPPSPARDLGGIAQSLFQQLPDEDGRHRHAPRFQVAGAVLEALVAAAGTAAIAMAVGIRGRPCADRAFPSRARGESPRAARQNVTLRMLSPSSEAWALLLSSLMRRRRSFSESALRIASS
jgi:hypothetical protein